MRGLASTWRRARTTAFALAILAVLASLPFGFAAVVAAGTVQVNVNVSNLDGNSELPQISNGAGQLGIVWSERNTSRYGYSEFAAGQNPGAPSYPATGGKVNIQAADLALDRQGTAHMAYSVEGTVFYRQKPAGGTWSAAGSVATSDFPNPVRIAVSSSGRIWVVWRDTNGTGVFFRFSDNGGASWSGGATGGVVAQETGNMIAPDVIVDSSGNAHVVWYIRSSGADRGEVKYADYDGTRWTVAKLTNDGAALADQDPVLAIDSNNVQHAVWRKSVGDNWAIIYARRAPGGAWTGFNQIGQTAGNAGFSPAVGVGEDGSIYATFSTFVGSQRRIVLLAQVGGTGVWQTQNLTDGSRFDSNSSVTGTAGFAHVAYQRQTRGIDDSEIYYARVNFGPPVTPTPTPAPIGAQPTLDGGALFTKNPQVTVTFDKITGNPTEVRWRWNDPPTDATNDSGGWKPFANPLSVPLPSQSADVCGTLVLYTQVRSSSLTQTGSQKDDIIYDAGVQVNIGTYNPKISGETTSYNQGASLGAANYTRTEFYHLVINNNGDCAGLQSFQVNETQPVTLPDTGFENVNQFIGNTDNGAKNYTIVVTDKNGNTRTFSQKMTLDKGQGSAPVVNGQAVQVGIAGGNSLTQNISVTGAQVSDNLYGPDEGLPDGKRFWGVALATSRTQLSTDQISNSTTLQWTPVRVPDPTVASFSVRYSLVSGLNLNGLNNGAVGSYFVYLKFLDGAGNMSAWTSDALPVTLTAGYAVPRLDTPVIQRK